MTYAEAVDILRGAGIDSPEVDARLIFAAYTGARYPDLRLIHSDSEELISAVRRRQSREPLQYILGRVGFYREEYRVSPACLIPRPDTEHLVDFAVRHIPRGELFLDLCTGSGCVAVSTLCNTRDTRAVAVDLSRDALDIAEQNADDNGVISRCEFRRIDLMSSGEELAELKPYAVLSNPPYISREAYSALEPEIFAEPEMAFVGGEDGGDFYRRLLPLSLSLIKPEGFVAFEIGYDQQGLAEELAEMHGCRLQVIRDYGSNPRVAVFRRARPLT